MPSTSLVPFAQNLIKHAGAKLITKFSVKKMHLVMGGLAGRPVNLTQDGRPVTVSALSGIGSDIAGNVNPSETKLYRLIKSPILLKDQTLKLTPPEGIRIKSVYLRRMSRHLPTGDYQNMVM